MTKNPQPTFSELEAELTRAGRIEELIRLYEARAKQVPLFSEATQVLQRAAELARDRMKNLARAEDLFRRALLFSPRSADVLRGLRQVHEQRQDPAALAE